MAGKKPCPDDKILNPATGRCVKRDGRIGKQLLAASVKASPSLRKKTQSVSPKIQSKTEPYHIIDNPDIWPMIKTHMSLDAYINTLIVLKHPSITRSIDLRKQGNIYLAIPSLFRPVFAMDVGFKALMCIVGKMQESYKYMITFYGNKDISCVVLTIKARNMEQYVQLFAYVNGAKPKDNDNVNVHWYVMEDVELSTRFDYEPVVEFIFNSVLTYNGADILKSALLRKRPCPCYIYKYYVLHDFKPKKMVEAAKQCFVNNAIAKYNPTFISCKAKNQDTYELGINMDALNENKLVMHISMISTLNKTRIFHLKPEVGKDFNVFALNIQALYGRYSMHNKAFNMVWQKVYGTIITYVRDTLGKQGFRDAVVTALKKLKKEASVFDIDKLYHDVLTMNKTPFIYYFNQKSTEW